MKNVVVIGGGTGIYPITSALKHLKVLVTTIVGVSDSGGSTGRIRDEFGFQPVGDLRQSLAALAESRGQTWIRKLLLYRFDKGSGLKGHNLGNLILTALQDMTGSTDEALKKAANILRIEGTVITSTTDNVELKIVYQDGSFKIGEDLLNKHDPRAKLIDHIEHVPPSRLNPRAAEAIVGADLIIIGPGDLYASLLTCLIPSGVKKAFTNSKARICYITNLMTKVNQTKDMTAGDHLEKIEQALGKSVDHIIFNNEPISKKILRYYASYHEHPLHNDLSDDKRLIFAPILSQEANLQNQADQLSRSVLRHDSKKMIPVLKKLVNKS